MLLNLQSIKDKEAWESKGFTMPQYDVAALRKRTARKPMWLHFGAGNIFRAFPAVALQKLINAGKVDRGVIVAECFDGDIIERAYQPYDNLSIYCELGKEGISGKTVVASMTEALRCDGANKEDEDRLHQVLCAPSLQMVSLTITEKGYATTDANGRALPMVEKDIMLSPDHAQTTIGKLCAGLYFRYKANAKPLALVSMDNCSRNGDKLRGAILYIAEGWRENNFVTKEFLNYIEKKVSFPISMIDKITPRPGTDVSGILLNDGVDCALPFVTTRNTYTACYVNAEETEYLVIEDKFPNGRPALEDAGIYFTDRDTVDKAERMKVCTCLNPLHTALAVLGCMLGHTRICTEMQDQDLASLITKMAYTEGLPVVVDPGIIKPEDFLSAVLNLRLPNVFMPDAPQRIACDTSQKLPIRFGVTLRAYAASSTLDLNALKYIPFVLAAWLRYLTGIDDEGNVFEKSPDPMMPELNTIFGDVKLGHQYKEGQLNSFLCRADIFGVDLVAIHVAPKVEKYLNAMLEGKGAVRKVLHALVTE